MGRRRAYGPSTIKRTRRSSAEMEQQRQAIYDLVAENKPCTVRQVY
jgi:hypothetical protein